MRAAAIVASVAVLGVVLAAVFALRGISASPQVPTAQVERGPFVRNILAEGNLEPVEATPVNGPAESETARKISWMVPDGSYVREGEVVIRFDSTEMELKLLNGEADRATAESRIEGTEAQARGTIKNLGRDAEMARLELQMASQFQSKDPDIFSRHEIVRSEVDQELAAQRLGHAESRRAIREKVTGAELDLLEIEKRKAQIVIDEAERGLQGLEVRAPHDGILVYKRDWRGNTKKIGDSVWPNEPIGEIPRLEAMRAKVYVLEADAGGLEGGVPATVVLEAHPDRPVEAEIEKVATLARRRFGWVPVQYFEVSLRLTATDPEIMKPGQRLKAELRLDGRQAALVVPRGAVFELDGKRVVYRRDGARFEPVEVTLGPAGPGRVVVESGVAAGDEVALRDPTRPGEIPGQESTSGPAGPVGAGG
jgi:multidrug resistance efflux pump